MGRGVSAGGGDGNREQFGGPVGSFPLLGTSRDMPPSIRSASEGSSSSTSSLQPASPLLFRPYSIFFRSPRTPKSRILGVSALLMILVSSFRTNITFTASVHVSSDNLADPSSYLTCLGGAPLSGIHCAMNGMISVPGPIKLLAVANATSAKT